MIKIEVYSIFNCKDCSTYHHLLEYFCKCRDDVSYQIFDIDNEQNFHMIMEKKLIHIPSTLIYENDVLIRQCGGILSHIQLFDLVYGIGEH